MGLSFHHNLPYAYWRWQIARETGWSLEYIDNLTLADWEEFWQVRDGTGKVATAWRSK